MSKLFNSKHFNNLNSPIDNSKLMNPYLAGILLGTVLFVTFLVTGGGLGASAGFSSVQIGILDVFAPSHVDQVPYFVDKAGGFRNPFLDNQVYLLFGVFVGGLISGVLFRRSKLTIAKGQGISNPKRLILAFIGGVLMGYGARLARGCTSGQALSGGATLAVGSWVFMMCVFAGGYAIAYFFRKTWN